MIKTFKYYKDLFKIMKDERELKELIGKKIYVELISGRKYNGKITSVFAGFVHIIDKFNMFVMFAIDEIKLLEAKNDDNYFKTS